MNNNDEYLVYIRNDGTRFYYKNKELHREAGPAIVIPKEISQYTNLSDEYLYKKVTTPVIKIFSNDFAVRQLENGDFEIVSDPPIYFLRSCYFLDGKEYAKQEFNAILLKESLEKNKLKSEETDSKKTKV